MKTPHKTILLSSGIALGVIAVVFGATAGIADKHKNFEPASAGQYSLTLDSSNAPSGLSTSSFTETIQTTITTDSGNSLTFNIAMAKASNNNYVEIGYNGYMYNFGAETGRIKGITAITPVLASGSLKLSTSNVEFASGAYLGSATALTSGSRFILESPARYFQLKAGDSGAVITSLLIEYSCTGDADAYPTQKDFLEDFSGYSATGIGYDGSHGYGITTGLRAEYYSTYRGVASPDPADGTSWQIMGSDDYITYLSNKGRSSSKCGLFKVNANNSFKYFQTKAFFGVNSIIGKGNKFSFWARGAYTGTNASTNSSYNIELIAMVFYSGAKWNKSGSNSNIVTATYTIPASSNWTQYTLDIDKTKNVYAYGFCLKKASGTAYVPIDDISIYSTAEVNVTGIALDTNSKTINLNKTATLTPTISPSDATNKNVTWTSSNTSVATVADGVVTGVSAGNATITATTVDGGYTATCAITVLPEQTYFNALFVGNLRISYLFTTINFPVVISSTDNKYIAFTIYGADTGIALYENNGSTFSIIPDHSVTVKYNKTDYVISFDRISGSVSGGTFIDATVTNAKMGGSSMSITNNGDIDFVKQTDSNAWLNNCEGTTEQLQTVFARRWRYSGTDEWTWDGTGGNSDRVVRNTTYHVEGSSSMGFRGYKDGQSALTLNGDNSSIFSGKKNISFWVYNSSDSALSVMMFVYHATNYGGDTDNTGTYVVKPHTWTFVTCGYEKTVYNFQLFVEKAPKEALYYDNFCIYNS